MEVVGSGEVRVRPDVAFLDLGVETTAKTADAAGQANAAQLQGVIAALTGAGIGKDALHTRQLSVFPVERYPDRGGKPIVEGYRASNGLTVKITALDQVGKLVDLALARGANRLEQVRFDLQSPLEAQGRALEAAVRRAQAAAQTLARALGVPLGPVVEAHTGVAQQPPAPMMAMRAARAEGEATTPVLPEERVVEAQVTLVYSLESGR